MDRRGVTPQNEIRWQNQITLTQSHIMISEWGVTPPIDCQNKERIDDPIKKGINCGHGRR